MTQRKSSTGLAIVLSLVALILFDAMGLVIKRLSGSYTAVELSAYRNFFGLIPSALALWWSAQWHASGRPVRMRQWRLAILRGLAVTFAQLCFYTSLGAMAFATATTISYSNALFVTLLSIPLLGEKVGWVRWTAVVVGFVGVVMVMGLGRDAFVLAAILPVMAGAFYAFAAVSARLLDSDVPTPLVNLYSQSVAIVGALVLVALWGGFSPLASWADVGWIAAMGMFGGTAVLLLIVAYRMTESSNLAPFSYFGIPIAFVLGWAFFDETPWSDLYPGAVLIVFGGLLIVWRERRLRKPRSGLGEG